MNLAQVARMLAGIAAFFTLAQLPPLLMALQEQHPAFAATKGFVVSTIVGAFAAAGLWLAGRRARGQSFRKEAIAVAGLAWFLASVLGAIPFQVSGALPDPIDAVFETASGLTTTGATVLASGGNPDIPTLPHSLLLWRALLQWIGGIGIVLVFVTLLPAMGAIGRNLLASETVGVSTESFQLRAIEKARFIATFYAGATAICTVLLVVLGGYGWFDAICHSFTTLATGGYSTRASIAEFDSLGGELVMIVFMFLAGSSFSVLAMHWRTGLKSFRALARTGEFRIYCLVTVAMVAALTIALCAHGLPLASALRQAAFNGVSVLTSTGYATANFQTWPSLAVAILFCAMFVGGCTGSTAGGFKQVRLLVVFKLSAYTIRRFVRPKSVERIKLDNEAMPVPVISSVVAIVLLWFMTIVVCALVATCDPRLDLVAAFSSSASMLGSCGPALSTVDPGTALPFPGTPDVGPFGGYGTLHDWTKVLFTVEMVLGRLELLTLLALFTPGFWRR